MDAAWPPASDPPPLAADEVHVWRIWLDGDAPVDGPLDAQERAHLGRLRVPALRTRYAAAHIARRRLLARYLGRVPEAVTFDHAPCSACGKPHGKPLLAGEAPLAFNLARRGELALLAVATGGEVGVDIEDAGRGARTVAEVRRSIVARPEEAVLARFPASEQPRELVRLWSRKEAALKASGVGLNVAPSQLVVSAPTPGRERWRAVDGPELRCVVCDLQPGDGYVGALALVDRPRRVRTWTWEDH